MDEKWTKRQHRLYEIVEVGMSTDRLSRSYDFISVAFVILNVLVCILSTFDSLSDWKNIFYLTESITVLFFFIDYLLRILTASCRYSDVSDKRAIFQYLTSLSGVIDLLSFLPHYLPVFFPAGAVTFRMIRVVRVFRLFRLNTYYDSLNVITEVINNKKQQLLSSVFIILILMISSSLCMYSLEHDAQPEIFQNAFSGIWWSVATVLTVGYGDIYPITTLGKIFSIFITFLGVGMVAIPTGIISAGFVEQYARLKELGDANAQSDIQFLRIRIKEKDSWNRKLIQDLQIPKEMIIVAIERGSQMLIPKGDFCIQADDQLILGSKAQHKSKPVKLYEIILTASHPWVGQAIEELDISRQTMIAVIIRKGTLLVPHPDTRLITGDRLILSSRIFIDSDNQFLV